MLVIRQISPTCVEAAYPLDHLSAQAETEDKAVEALRTAKFALRYATDRLRVIRRATHIAYDPQERAYVADLPAADIAARGMTRQDAWDNLLQALRLADLARAAEHIDLTEPTEEHEQVQEDR